jgi:hypothetical protein
MGEFFVYADNYVGRCYWTAKRGRVSSMFSYDDAYIADRKSWNIDPALVFAGGAQRFLRQSRTRRYEGV